MGGFFQVQHSLEYYNEIVLKYILILMFIIHVGHF